MLAQSATCQQNCKGSLFSLLYHPDHISLLYHYQHKFKKCKFKNVSSSSVTCQVANKRVPEMFIMLNIAQNQHFRMISEEVLSGISRRSVNFQSQREYYCLDKCIVAICSQNFLSFLIQCYFRHSNP